MIKIRLFFLLSLFVSTAYSQQDLKIHYDKPATFWTEALPVGNGRLGAMVFGKVNEELIQLNEATLWSGGPVSKNVNPTAFENLAPVRQALTDGDYEKAYELTKKMQGVYSQSYMPLGDLVLKQNLGDNAPTAYYHRDLNMQDALATTIFTVDGVTYKREIFASAPGQCIVLKLTASQPKKLSVNLSAKSQLHFKSAIKETSLFLNGKAASNVDPNYIDYNKEPVVYDEKGCKGMRFELIVKPVIKDGTISEKDNNLEIKDATEIVILISAATSFNGFDKCPDSEGKDEKKLAEDYLVKAASKNYDRLLKDHLEDFHHFFNRVSFNLNESETDKTEIATDKRLEEYFKGAKDSNLEMLFFQYGRYLLISSSRTKEVPANLQGIWNKELRAPWSSNYTTNINLQMNYWPVETANLSELFYPLDGFIKNLSVTGAETAKEYYHARGWVVHHNSDIWALTNPVGDLGKGDPMWANWYMGANWLSRHLWEHYQFTSDKKYLKEIYPILKGAAEFTLDWLQEDKDGYLVTMPSTSPENRYYYDGKKKGSVTVATTMDMGIIKDLFGNITEASDILNTDQDFINTIKKADQKLFPFRIGSKKQLLEWYKDFEEEDPHHRHTSHLYALHPANLISPLSTPELANAAKTTLELRGDDGTGWSLGWKVNMWARLLDGNHAYKLFRNQLRLTKEGDRNFNKGGGVYANLFDAHPPFQIDGNFAATAGVIEMLMQSQNHEIHLLPALPDAWEEGAIKGIVARGNFTVDISWEKGKLSSSKITANEGGNCVIRYGEPFKVETLNLKSEKTTMGYTIKFKAKKGKSYVIKPAL